jgi:hypothetical protein
MAFNIPRQQQKMFIENFMAQTLTAAIELVEEGRDRPSPGETIYAIGMQLIQLLRQIDPTESNDGEING